jgi:hypothetical protein
VAAPHRNPLGNCSWAAAAVGAGRCWVAGVVNMLMVARAFREGWWSRPISVRALS